MAARSLLVIVSRRCLVVVAWLGLGCVNVARPWDSPGQSAGGSGARSGDSTDGRSGVSGAGGDARRPSQLGGTLGAEDALSIQRSETGDLLESGLLGAPSAPDSASVTGAGGNAFADTNGAGGVGGSSNSNGQVNSAAGAAGESSSSAAGSGGTTSSVGGSGGALTSAGGGGGTVSSAGGGGGSFAPADASNGSASPPSDAATASKCVGVMDSSICWQLGALGASCAVTCASWGRASVNARKHVGTTAQGGSLAECQRLLGLLGVTNNVISVSIGQGLGCHRKPSMPLPYAWTSSPDYSDNVSSPDASILCGCAR